MLYSALEIEFDAFWQSITATGFKSIISGHVAALIPITQNSSWMSSFPKSDNTALDEVFQGMERAVKLKKVHMQAQDKHTSSSDQESD